MTIKRLGMEKVEGGRVFFLTCHNQAIQPFSLGKITFHLSKLPTGSEQCG